MKKLGIAVTGLATLCSLVAAHAASPADCPNGTAVGMAQTINTAAAKVNGAGYEIDDVTLFNKVAGDVGLVAPEGTVTLLVGVGKGVGIAAVDKDGCLIGVSFIPHELWNALADKLGAVKFTKVSDPGT